MIYFLAVDDPRPRGGTKQIYRHVSALCRAGVPACALHTKVGFSYEFFEHDARLAYLGEGLTRRVRRVAGRALRRLRPDEDLDLYPGRRVFKKEGERLVEATIQSSDVLVFPEYLGVQLENAVTSLPIAVFNQNTYGTFRKWGFQPRRSNVYQQPNTRGAVCVSEQNRKYLSYAFPHLDVRRAVNGIDTSLFHPNGLTEKKRTIAYMPRKLGDHLEQVIQILHQRRALEGFQLAPIEGVAESRVAEIMREATVFLSASHEEGFGLPPVEAGLCGCLVVGYTGVAGEEFFYPDLTWPVLQGDVLAFAESAESVLRFVEREPEQAKERQLACAERLKQSYSLEHERASVISAWKALFPEQFPAG